MTPKEKLAALVVAADAKTGEADTTLTDAMQTLIDGYGGDVFDVTFTGTDVRSKLSNSTVNTDVCVRLPEATICQNVVSNMSGAEKVYLYISSNIVTLSQTFFNIWAHEVYIYGDTSNVTTWMQTFHTNRAAAERTLEVIGGDPLDFSSVTVDQNSTFGNQTKLREVRFVKNSIKHSIYLRYDSLSNETDVSIANGLDSDAVSQTVTMNSKPTTILGYVSDGEFIQDDAGSLTLADFITNTKGWTLA